MSERAKIRNYLAYAFTEPIRDPLWSHVYLSPGLMGIVGDPSFQKLSRIRQLGPTYMVYPGATHTRLNHSLGVFELAKRMIRALTAFDAANELSETGVRSFLCAALLHDVGHFPYAHSLKELPLQSHESLTAKAILNTSLRIGIERGEHGDAEMTAKIVDTALDSQGNREIEIYRKLLSGVLDPDKLDYLTRDAYFCGIPYGVQDTDLIISKLEYLEKVGLVVEEQGIHAVENVLFSKYLMYRSVYWHRAVRIATAMIKKAVYMGMTSGDIQPEALYGLDDDSFVSTFGITNSDSSILISQVNKRDFFKTVWEEPFDPSNKNHTRLLDLNARHQLEKQFSEELGIAESDSGSESAIACATACATELIIDIPEQISFEVDLLIHREDGLFPFVDSGTVFKEEVVSGFTNSLRKIRIFAPRQYAEKIYKSEVFGRWLKT
ncbi:MAG: HD domain-containing protein [Spirochaetales bacterium]|jgi:uncharacterized protein|nr:HD domain-containing protein [Spirochaetales bacterium]